MTRGVWRLLSALSATLGASLAAAGLGPSEHLLHPATAVPGGLSVAFVGDGFTATDLPTYGKAVNALIEGLLDQDVYYVHQRRFNFYRVDVVDVTGVTTSGCSPPVALAQLTSVPIAGNPNPPVNATKSMDLEVTHCWGGGNDKILYTSKEFEAIELAATIPGLKAVVVVANARLKAGGAQLLVTPQQTTVVVVGAHASPQGQGADWAIDEHAVALLAHELAHALGLLDEYDHLNTGQIPPFQECRNVWKPDAPPQWPTSPTWPTTAKPIPWHGVLTRCCTPQSMVRCQAHEPDGICVLQDLEAAEAYCSFVPQAGNPNGACFAPPECNVFPGAWEGAFYAPTDYYRSKESCRMESTGVNQQFCPACREYLDIYLEHFGANPGVGPWPEDRCLSSACPVQTPPLPSIPPPPAGLSRQDAR
jgi:hypothetical protein